MYSRYFVKTHNSMVVTCSRLLQWVAESKSCHAVVSEYEKTWPWSDPIIECVQWLWTHLSRPCVHVCAFSVRVCTYACACIWVRVYVYVLWMYICVTEEEEKRWTQWQAQGTSKKRWCVKNIAISSEKKGPLSVVVAYQEARSWRDVRETGRGRGRTGGGKEGVDEGENIRDVGQGYTAVLWWKSCTLRAFPKNTDRLSVLAFIMSQRC